MSKSLIVQSKNSNGGKMQYRKIGLLASPFAFTVSFFGHLSIGSAHSLETVLADSPGLHINYVISVFFYALFPPMAILAILMVGSLLKRELFAELNYQWTLIIMGIFYFVSGISLLGLSCSAYNEALHIAHSHSLFNIDGLFLAIYGLCWVADTLWILVGIFFLTLYKTMRNGKQKEPETRIYLLIDKSIPRDYPTNFYTKNYPTETTQNQPTKKLKTDETRLFIGPQCRCGKVF